MYMVKKQFLPYCVNIFYKFVIVASLLEIEISFVV